MSKDDYHVIVYQILAYLYQCLKKGIDVEEKDLQNNSKLFQINRDYWMYILLHMQAESLIEGIVFTEIDGMKYPFPTNIGNCRITPVGIDYLCDNSFIQKAKRFVKDVNGIVPFNLF